LKDSLFVTLEKMKNKEPKYPLMKDKVENNQIKNSKIKHNM